MKWIALLIASLMLLSLCGMGQPDKYGTRTTGGAPTPTTPVSPEDLGLQTPSLTGSSQAPTAQESSQGLMSASQQMAYSAPQGQKLAATGPAITKMIVPPGGFAPNSLYISYAPQTVAGCNYYAYLPLWLQTSRSGSAWFYEWYPSGYLDVNYAGYINYPGWYKRWFFADVPGWHILQYYCNGWSNYAYVYVYGQGPGYWVNPGPYYEPNPLPYTPPVYSPPIYPFVKTGQAFYKSKFIMNP